MGQNELEMLGASYWDIIPGCAAGIGACIPGSGDKLRLQQGPPLPGREFGPGGPTAYPACIQKPRVQSCRGR